MQEEEDDGAYSHSFNEYNRFEMLGTADQPGKEFAQLVWTLEKGKSLRKYPSQWIKSDMDEFEADRFDDRENEFWFLLPRTVMFQRVQMCFINNYDWYENKYGTKVVEITFDTPFNWYELLTCLNGISGCELARKTLRRQLTTRAMGDLQYDETNEWFHAPDSDPNPYWEYRIYPGANEAAEEPIGSKPRHKVNSKGEIEFVNESERIMNK